MRILVVDVDYASRSKLKAILAFLGDTDGASNGDLALKMIEAAFQESVPYGLIAMDVGLPDIDGRDIVQIVRDVERENDAKRFDLESKILMVSVMGDAETIKASFDCGCDEYIVKPVTPGKIYQALTKLNLTADPTADDGQYDPDRLETHDSIFGKNN